MVAVFSSIVVGFLVYVTLSLPTKIIIALVMAFLTFTLFKFLFDPKRTRFGIKSPLILSLNHVLSKYWLIIIIALYALSAISTIIPPINQLQTSWGNIPFLNWLRFCSAIISTNLLPGYLFLRFIDRRKELPKLVNLVLSYLLSIFFVGLLGYLLVVLRQDFSISPLVVVIFNGLLLPLFIRNEYKLVRTRDSQSGINKSCIVSSSKVILLMLVVIIIAVYFSTQFVFEPFIRSDNWRYLAGANQLINNIAKESSNVEYYGFLTEPNWSFQFLAVFLSFAGFPQVNAFMLASFFMGLLPIAFFSMASAFFKGRERPAVISTFIYILFSGFGWIYFVMLQCRYNLLWSAFEPNQLRNTLLEAGRLTLYDFFMPSGLPQEAGLRTYALSLLAVIMLLYLLFSKKTSSHVRYPLLSILVALPFLIHIEEISIVALVFLPPLILFTNEDVRKDFFFMLLGMIFVFFIDMFALYQVYTQPPAAFILCISALSFSMLGARWIKRVFMKIKPNVFSLVGSLGLPILIYLYCLAAIVFFSGGSNFFTDFTPNIFTGPYAYPWYYYPIRLGVTGLLVLAGFIMLKLNNSPKHEYDSNLKYIVVVIPLLIIFSKMVSYVNTEIFFTGLKEFRVVTRLLPIPTALIAGWTLGKLFSKPVIHFSATPTLRSLKSIGVVFILILIVVGGSMSTLLSSDINALESVPSGPSYHIFEEDKEASSFLKNNADHIYRTVTLTSMSQEWTSMSGGGARWVGINGNYPNIFSATSPETIFLLSTDVRYLYLADRDYSELQSDIYKNSIFTDYLQFYLPRIYENPKVMIYELPYFSPPNPSSKTAYLIPETLTSNSFFSLSSIALSNYSYDVFRSGDSMLFENNALVLPLDYPKDTTPVNLTVADKFTGQTTNVTDISSSFNGLNDYVRGVISPNIPAVFTVDFWFKWSKTDGTFVQIMSLGSGQEFTLFIQQPANLLYLKVYNPAQGVVLEKPLEKLNDAVWYHVSAGYDGSNFFAYLNGEGKLFENGTTPLFSNNMFTFGTSGDIAPSSNFFKGVISEAHIYNTSYVSGYSVNDILSWVKEGRQLVVFGDAKGEFFNRTNSQIIGTTSANGISGSNLSMSLPKNVSVPVISLKESYTDVLANYTLDNKPIAPLAFASRYGAGQITYINLAPYFSLLETEKNSTMGSSLFTQLGNLLSNMNLSLQKANNELNRYPVDSRWMDKYPLWTYENNANFTGTIEVNTDSLDLTILRYVKVDNLTILLGNGTRREFHDATITKVTSDKQMNFIQVCSSDAKISTGNGVYLGMIFSGLNLSMAIPNDANATMFLLEGSGNTENPLPRNSTVIIESKDDTYLILRHPEIIVKGETEFGRATLSSSVTTEQIWAQSIDISGATKFTVDFSDTNTLFARDLVLNGSIKVPQPYPKWSEWAIPWRQILTSPLHILLIAAILIAAIAYWLISNSKVIRYRLRLVKR